VKWARRRPAVASLLAGLALTLLTGFVGMTVLWLRAEDARQQAVNNQERATHNFLVALAVIDEFSNRAVRLPRPQRDQVVDFRDHLLQNVERLYQKVKARPGMEEEAVELARGVSLLKLGYELIQLGDTQQANDTLEKTYARFERLAELHPEEPDHQRNFAYSLFQLAGLYYRSNRADLAEQSWQKVLTLEQRLVAAHPEDLAYQEVLAATRLNLGVLYHDQDRLTLAEEQLRQGLDLTQRLADALPGRADLQRQLARAQLNLGRLYRDLGRMEQARLLLTQARAILQRLVESRTAVPESELDLSRVLVNLGEFYKLTRQPRLQDQACQQAVEVNRRLVANYPQMPKYRDDLALSYMNQGDFYQSLGQPERAERVLRQALTIYESLLNQQPDHADFTFLRGATCLNLAGVRNDLDDSQAALEFADRALRDLDAARQKNPQKDLIAQALVIAHAERAVALGKRGRHREAAEAIGRAFAEAKDQNRSDLRLYQALVLAYAGDLARAAAEAKALAGQPGLPPRTWLDLGRVHAVAATAAVRDQRLPVTERQRLAEAYAEQALTLWAKAHADEYVLSPKMVERFLAEVTPLSPRIQAAGRKLQAEIEKGAQDTNPKR
jgi:tetratricopeptide (TPR) repeat protein